MPAGEHRPDEDHGPAPDGTLGVGNARFDASIVRGFSYYTGVVFEVYDTHPENNRALFGGGRYDNLTEMFDDEPITGVGFGMGDVTMRDFLEVRGLGILNIRTMFGETAVRRKKSLKLIVHLHRPTSSDLSKMERLPFNASFQDILGISVSTVSIPVMAGRNLAVLVEAASRNFVLQQRGIDTMQEFIARHEKQMLEE